MSNWLQKSELIQPLERTNFNWKTRMNAGASQPSCSARRPWAVQPGGSSIRFRRCSELAAPPAISRIGCTTHCATCFSITKAALHLLPSAHRVRRIYFAELLLGCIDERGPSSILNRSQLDEICLFVQSKCMELFHFHAKIPRNLCPISDVSITRFEIRVI